MSSSSSFALCKWLPALPQNQKAQNPQNGFGPWYITLGFQTLSTVQDSKHLENTYSWAICTWSQSSVVEYWQQYPLCRIQHHKTFENIYRTLRETSSFPQTNTKHGQLYGGIVYCNEAQIRVYKKFPGHGVSQTQVWRILCPEGFYLYRFHLLWGDYSVYGFVNGCNHKYPFCRQN
jgi:hypothetical protein